MGRSLCPLCSKDLGLSSEPQSPHRVLQVLGEHFGQDCAATARAPRSRLD